MPSWPWTFATLPAGNVAASKLDDNFIAAMFSAGSSINGAVPTWNGTGGNQLNNGGYTLGGAPTNIPVIDGYGLMPTGIGVASAYLSFDGASTIYTSLNIASAVKTAAGTYDVTFAYPPPTAVYVAMGAGVFSVPGICVGIINKTPTVVTVGTFVTDTLTLQDSPFDLVCFW